MPQPTLSQIPCTCAMCDQHPHADSCGWGEYRPNGWWCEWCLSCGCHDVDRFGTLMLPNCSTERFGFPDSIDQQFDGYKLEAS